MALNIKSDEAEQAVRRLAELTGESITETIRIAAEERLARLEATRQQAELRRRADIRELLEQVRRAPVLDNRPEDEILGYDDLGMFD
ncbi:type II toxin-antitoxin system VapB family antitoxin [Indioceanicola profundi]|uniref:type II toxin-antitoxin system VapB family antitoxin n=1 Tax=Indioceanicola profundi TaxID=2220096 RepID=UPI000E6AC03D|nr:type II toxin-antitoxin system VapB family antitoxin [Indioceanicola profundi]